MKGEKVRLFCKSPQLLEGYLQSMAKLHVATREENFFWDESGKLRKLWKLQAWFFFGHDGMN